MLYIADANHHRIRVINFRDGSVSTLAGAGKNTPFVDNAPAHHATFSFPNAIAFSPDGTRLYVSDWGNHCVRAIDMNTKLVSTVAGRSGDQSFRDGPALQARFNLPYGVAVNKNGTIYVADCGNNRIRAIEPTTGHVETVAGTGTAGHRDGPPAQAQFNNPQFVAVDPDGVLYVADRENHCIRTISEDRRQVTTYAGIGLMDARSADGSFQTQFFHPMNIAFGSTGLLYVACHSDGAHHILAICNNQAGAHNLHIQTAKTPHQRATQARLFNFNNRIKTHFAVRRVTQLLTSVC
jgi:DNA-binding beta-propeller fold protein YncE